jgi:hypothetical protein
MGRHLEALEMFPWAWIHHSVILSRQCIIPVHSRKDGRIGETQGPRSLLRYLSQETIFTLPGKGIII